MLDVFGKNVGVYGFKSRFLCYVFFLYKERIFVFEGWEKIKIRKTKLSSNKEKLFILLYISLLSNKSSLDFYTFTED